MAFDICRHTLIAATPIDISPPTPAAAIRFSAGASADAAAARHLFRRAFSADFATPSSFFTLISLSIFSITLLPLFILFQPAKTFLAFYDADCFSFIFSHFATLISRDIFACHCHYACFQIFSPPVIDGFDISLFYFRYWLSFAIRY